MISKNSRRITGAVEDLKQGGFTAVKGIDETAPALSSDTVLHSVNLDIDRDGGLILRKPLIAAKVFPKYYFYAPTHIIPITDSVLFLIYQYDGICTGRVLDYTSPENPIDVPLHISWVRYDNYLEIERSDIPTNVFNSGFYNLSMFDLEDITFANLATNVLIYGSKIKFKDEFLCDRISNEDGTSACAPTLIYEDLLDDDFIYRPLQIIPYLDKSKVPNPYVKIKIGYAELTELTPDGDIPLDANLNLDFPYALRDGYDKATYSIDSILAYIPTHKKDGNVVPNSEVVDGDTFSNTKNLRLSDVQSFTNVANKMSVRVASRELWQRYFNHSDRNYTLDLTVNLSTDKSETGSETVVQGTLDYDISGDIVLLDALPFIKVDSGTTIAGTPYITWNFRRIIDEGYPIWVSHKLCTISCKGSHNLNTYTSKVQALTTSDIRLQLPIDSVQWNEKCPFYPDILNVVTAPDGSSITSAAFKFMNPELWKLPGYRFPEILISSLLGFLKYSDGTYGLFGKYSDGDFNISCDYRHHKEGSAVYIGIAHCEGDKVVEAYCFRLPKPKLSIKNFTVYGRAPIDINLLEDFV